MGGFGPDWVRLGFASVPFPLRRAPGTRYGPADPTAAAASRLPCGARFGRGPHELASLRQHVALIRPKLRSSAPQKGSTNPYRVPGFGAIESLVLLGGCCPHPSPLPEGRGRKMDAPRACPRRRVVCGAGWVTLLRRRAAQRLADQGHMLFERSEFMWTPPNASSAGESRSDRRSRVARAVPHAARRRAPATNPAANQAATKQQPTRS